MKIWIGNGSEHSANLVLIGEFKTEADMNKAIALLNHISALAAGDLADGEIDHWGGSERYSESTEKELRAIGTFNFSPNDISDFALVNPSLSTSGSRVKLSTNDVDIGGFVKLLVGSGAKVQIFSGHDYPDELKLQFPMEH